MIISHEIIKNNDIKSDMKSDIKCDMKGIILEMYKFLFSMALNHIITLFLYSKSIPFFTEKIFYIYIFLDHLFISAGSICSPHLGQ
jgi:hypothetical protein